MSKTPDEAMELPGRDGTAEKRDKGGVNLTFYGESTFHRQGAVARSIHARWRAFVRPRGAVELHARARALPHWLEKFQSFLDFADSARHREFPAIF